jgi:hypothetical protein
MTDPVANLIDRQRVEDVVTRLFVHTDERDWPKVIECFADEVLFDMKSMTGEEAKRLPAADIAQAWSVGLAPLEAVHHQVGNFLTRVEGATATSSCYGIASHFLPNKTGQNTRVFVGNYEFGLTRDDERWRIDRFKFNLKYVDGNLELEDT